MRNPISFPLRYLALQDEKKGKLYRRDWARVLLGACAVSLPFWVTGANYFGSDGFIDRVSAFTGVLTGFYVAALVGIASFATTDRGMDEVIVSGAIIDPRQGQGEGEPLTRRQYVCALFGYLAFLSMIFALAAILLLSIAPFWAQVQAFTPDQASWALWLIRGAVLFLINGVIAHIVITTCHGLYYLIERLYSERDKVNPKDAG